ncbi:MAG: hypothetical protein N2116_06400 [Armatimonadetes bacterium]|nr:hypothetical protein [Armatimonadota bacterium]
MKDRHRLLLTVLVIAVVAGWLWAASAFLQHRNLRAQIRNLQNQTVETQKLLERAKEQRERYERLVQELGKPLTSFDPGRLTAKFMEQVEGALTQSKIKAETIQPLPWQINPEISAVRLSVQVTAVTAKPTISEGLQSLTELLMRLRSMRPPISVERLNVQAISQPREGLRIQAQLVWLVPVEESVLKKWAVQTRRPIRR